MSEGDRLLTSPDDVNFGRDPTCYFTDGERIDYVLVWHEDTTKTSESDEKQLNHQTHRKWRENFEAELQNVGVLLQKEDVVKERMTSHYTKLNVPWPVLCRFAEDMNLRCPIEIMEEEAASWFDGLLDKLHLSNLLNRRVPLAPPIVMTAVFRPEIFELFLNRDDHENFFTETQRQKIANKILASCVYGQPTKGEVGIDRLVKEQVYNAAYTLHDGPYESETGASALCYRQVLYQYWAKYSCWYRYQPLDHVHHYFGEAIAFYFAWLGTYTTWLLPAALIGLFGFIYGLVTVNSHSIVQDVCNSNKTYLMCPVCKGCPYWYLYDACTSHKIARIFDNGATVSIAIFISLWAVLFLESWKRKSAELTYRWHCKSSDSAEEPPRAEYTSNCTEIELNPVTGDLEVSFSRVKQVFRMTISFFVLIAMIGLVCGITFALIAYRMAMIKVFYSSSIPLFESYAESLSTLSASFISYLFSLLFGSLYGLIADRMTDWEMHRTQTEFDDNKAFKLIVFQFFNFMIPIGYIAFFKGTFTGYPGHYNHIFGLRYESCSPAGCLVDLAEQLTIVLVGQMVISDISELLIPYIETKIHQFRTGYKQENAGEKGMTRYEEDCSLIEYEGLFDEYFEMIIQFGLVVIFIAAFPLAPLLALINNWIEIRLDAKKLVCSTRRPLPQSVKENGIGYWCYLLEILTKIAVFSNALLIAYTSDYVKRVLYEMTHGPGLNGFTNFTLAHAPNGTTALPCRYEDLRDENGRRTEFYFQLIAVRLAFVVIFEHFVFVVVYLVDSLISEVPHHVLEKMKRERWLEKETLQKSFTVSKHKEDLQEDFLEEEDNLQRAE